MNVLPRRLAAPEPTWTVTTDVVVVGSGIAGLSVALDAAACGLDVVVVTKADVGAGSTHWAQGGIAAAIGEDDSPEQHLHDTLAAGAGLCDEAAVRVLVTEGPQRLRELMERGAAFDRFSDGSMQLVREGGHRRNRVVHAGGDATGVEVQRALEAAVRRARGVRVIEQAIALDLLTAADGRVAGLSLHTATGSPGGVGAVLGRAVVLATGGMGRVFTSTTNPPVSTGDGVALALRAGAVVTDLEFVQFHPTVLFLPDAGAGQQPLVSEALRGEGAVLVDGDGRRFMRGVHELADLAPRDVVTKAIMRVMRAEGSDHVWLDARQLGEQTLLRRFPSIMARCRAAGIDPACDLIPVAPAAHYTIGGVWTDLDGRTSVPGLYACGEVACTAVHGANRLASNSLLEGLVFAGRVAADLARSLPPRSEPASVEVDAGLLAGSVSDQVATAMTAGAGIIRSADSLNMTLSTLDTLSNTVSAEPRAEAWEATNLHTVATVLAMAAARRQETRGCHWREDFPDRDDEHWQGHVRTVLMPDGTLSQTYEAAR